ncbi:28S ribosomal protein S10, mitochondrial [Chelonus insularis]|uniref:28S ribosomal protein S10, mitochondrial n=1 Tax=Chelonus insularis TaxID=460826 RepID=UPI00158C99C7|nr:28S ribosomal protein S10, mitochondrial [Chelonus insularis]
MFLSKNIPCVRNLIFTKSQRFLQTEAESASKASVPQTETGTPDKLYKKVEIELRGNDVAVLKSYGIFASTTAKHLGLEITRNSAPRKPHHERYTILKSAFVHKDHRVQYEFRTYFRFIDFARLTESTADTLLEYLQRNLPEGVAMKVTKHEIQPIPEHIRNPPQTNT